MKAQKSSPGMRFGLRLFRSQLLFYPLTKALVFFRCRRIKVALLVYSEIQIAKLLLNDLKIYLFHALIGLNPLLFYLVPPAEPFPCLRMVASSMPPRRWPKP